ncbi:hypothetical protein FS837_012303 [Tulasnella sp. UAMH 9824]|nr:hypothetical protein FS837_012303 [Tulasnella sp. UAMH 9824]
MKKWTKDSEPLAPSEEDSESSAEVKVSKFRFDSVPPETWLLAFRYLSLKDHLQLLLVSSFFRQLAEQYVYERIDAKFTNDQPAYQRSLACLQSIKDRPQAAAAVRWLGITVPVGGESSGLPLGLIKDVLASVEKLHFLRLYGLGEILPKDMKKGCLQYLKAYRGSPGSLADRGELPAVIELGYFEDGRSWNLEPLVPVPWSDVIRGLPINFPSLKTVSLGRFQKINDEQIEAIKEILPILRLERLDFVNFTPWSVSEELPIVQSFHSLCPSLRSIRLSTYNGDWRYLSQYDVWTTEDYDRRKLETEARAKQPIAGRNQFTLPDTVKHLWNAAEVKLRFSCQ